MITCKYLNGSTKILLAKGTAHRNKKLLYVEMKVYKCTNCGDEGEMGVLAILRMSL